MEAGLRAPDKYTPFPGALNSRLTSQIIDIHFVTTSEERENLLTGSVSENRLFVVGDTGIDSFFLCLNRIANKKPGEIPELKSIYFNKKVIPITGNGENRYGKYFRILNRS